MRHLRTPTNLLEQSNELNELAECRDKGQSILKDKTDRFLPNTADS